MDDFSLHMCLTVVHHQQSDLQLEQSFSEKICHLVHDNDANMLALRMNLKAEKRQF